MKKNFAIGSLVLLAILIGGAGIDQHIISTGSHPTKGHPQNAAEKARSEAPQTAKSRNAVTAESAKAVRVLRNSLKGGSDGNLALPVAPNRKRVKTALDSIEITKTITEHWINGKPTTAGWYGRIRIVETTFKTGLLRIEENVEIARDGEDLTEVRAFIERAADARHVLVSARHSETLEGGGFPMEGGTKSNLFKVAVRSPERIASLPETIADLHALGIDGVEADAVVETSGLSNDPMVGNGSAWHLENLGLLRGHKKGSDVSAKAAWDIRSDASEILIALVDTGVAEHEPDILPALWVRPGEIFGDGIDNDGNGFIDDIRGYDFYHDDALAEDENGHGTSCALLMGAAGNNGSGSSGVAWQASILNCKFMNVSGLGTLSDAIDAINYARESGAKILNLSWSYSGDAPVLRDALAACDEGGMLIVCASGNSGYQVPVPAPASIDLPNLVAVAASTPDDNLAWFSVVDPTVVDIAAPGVNLPVHRFGNSVPVVPGIRYETGTSFSAAIVSAALALGRAEFPSETPARTLARMLETAKPIPGGAAALVSGGRLDLRKMLAPGDPFPPNGLFARRTILSDTAGLWTGRNDGNHVEAIDSSLGLPQVPQRSVWFEWTAGNAGLLRIATAETHGNTATLSVFSVLNGLPSTLKARGTGSGVLEIPVTTGERLFWMIDSAQPSTGGLRLLWHLPPPNDNLADATVVQGIPLRLKGNSLAATIESLEEDTLHFGLITPPGSLWWKWIPGAAATADISASNNHMVFLLEQTGGKPDFSVVSILQAVSGSPYSVEAEKTYYLLAVPLNAASAGPFDLTVFGTDDFTLLSQPSNVAALPGEIVEIGFSYAGRGVQVIQWYKNGEPIAFATDPELKFSPVSSENYGSYHAEIRTRGGTIRTGTATLSPREEAPRVVSLTQRKSVVTGQAVSFSAVFNSASPVTYVWKKGGTTIPGATSNFYSLVSATIADAGNYSLTATNSFGSTTATVQLEVISTPWNGWVDRTPGSKGSGKVFNVSLIGDKAAAFTATECRLSTDAGQSWKPLRMPPGFYAQTGQMKGDGTLLVSGFSFPGYLTSVQGKTYRFTETSGWVELTPRITLPGATESVPFYGPERLYQFDGKWWTIAIIDFRSYPSFSTDGENWTVLTDPANPNLQNRATAMFAFEGALAIHFWNSGSSQAAMLIQPGGAKRRIPFSGDVGSFLRVGTGSYARTQTNGTMRVNDGENTPTFFLTPNVFPTNHGEGGLDNGLIVALEDGGTSTGGAGGNLFTGIHEKTFSKKAIGFTSYAKSGSRWIVGYPDGTVWSGTDIRKLPEARNAGNLMNPRLEKYRDEWVFGGFHSSDGGRWQRLGARFELVNQIVPEAQSGSAFYHSLKAQFPGTAERRIFSPAMWPSATERAFADTQGKIYTSGTSEIVRRKDTTSGFAQTPEAELTRVKPGASAPLMESADLSLNRMEIENIRDFGGRWFLTKPRDGFNTVPNPVYTSANGLNWQTLNFPLGTVFGKNGGTFIAIQSATGAFLSTNGTGWTPVVMNGLPAGQTPSNIESYRGFFVASFSTKLYASQNGISWSEATPPLPVGSLSSNRNTLLVVSSDNRVLQPGGENESGPWIEMPRAWEQIAVTRHSGFLYKLEIGDDDGDLSSVDCYLNGTLLETKTAPPFHFKVNPTTTGTYAVEFAAKDSQGRTSRVTSKLAVLGTGSTDAVSVKIDTDLSKAFLFKGKYYRVARNGFQPSALFVWAGGDQWIPVSPANFVVTAAAANPSAIVGVTTGGLLVSRDGVKWELLGGIVPDRIGVRDDTFSVGLNFTGWTSRDGYSWERSDAGTFNYEQIVWAKENFGLLGNSVTYDGGNTFIPLEVNFGSNPKIAPVLNGILILSNDINGKTLYRIQENQIQPTELAKETGWPLKMQLGTAGGMVWFGKTGEFLRSTVNGTDFTELAVPGNLLPFGIHKLGSEWFSISSDAIYKSSDLRSWALYKQLPYSSDPYYNPSFFRVITGGIDSIVVEHAGFPTKNFIIREGLPVSETPRRESLISDTSIPESTTATGLKFKQRWIASTNWWFTKPLAGGVWERAGLRQGAGWLTPNPQSWPLVYHSSYSPTTNAPFAASLGRYVMLHPDLFNPGFNFVVTSDDAVNFFVNPWTGSIPLGDIFRLVASDSGFLALASNGRVLRSPDGLTWSAATVISGGLNLSGGIWFSGKWHVSGRSTLQQGGSSINQGQVWSSADGVSWSLTGTRNQTTPKDSSLTKTSFTAGGMARLYAGGIGWMKSTDGNTWTDDAPLNATTYFPVRGGHPEGIFASIGTSFGILDATTGMLLRQVNTGVAGTAWLDGNPFIVSQGRFDEWTETDPRLTSISAAAKDYGVGDFVEISLTGEEIPDSTVSLEFFLTADESLGNEGDVRIGVSNWSGGQALADNARRFSFPLPPEIAAGRFRVGAVMGFESADATIQNNRTTSGNTPVQVPGYELQLTTSGEGNVMSNDTRPVYPLGARLQLEAVPGNGYSLSGWNGSVVSTQAAISLEMDSDKSLSITFVQGYRLNVRTVGKGNISGAPGVRTLPPGSHLALNQTAGDGWAFDCWMVNGIEIRSPSLSHQPSADTLIEGVFVPDFEARRTAAFSGKPTQTSRRWNDDPDGDGLSTWQELLLNTNPTLRQTLEERIEMNNRRMRLVFTRPQGSVSSPWVKAEFSDKLSGWESADGLRLSERVLSQQDGMETVEILLPFSAGKSGFFRLKMREAPAE